MGLTTILSEDNFTIQFYVKKGGSSRKSSPIDPNQDKMAIFGHIMAKLGKLWVSLQFWLKTILQAYFR